MSQAGEINKSLLHQSSDYWWLHGKAKIYGGVVATTCDVIIEDKWQVLDFGAVAFDFFTNKNEYKSKEISFKFKGCNLENKNDLNFLNEVRITFDGEIDENIDTFMLNGSARGLSLKVIDQYNNTVQVGKPIINYNNANIESLKYTFKIVRNSKPLKVGSYNAVVRYNIYYN